MKIILSPAKSLDLESPYFKGVSTTLPVFLKEADHLMNALQKKSPNQLKTLMKLSDKLANLNWERNQDWQAKDHTKKGRPAIFSFIGDVYKGLDVQSLESEKVGVLQNKLRILSGLYGLLKPLDKILPYRLEMGIKFGGETHKNLYDFWGVKIKETLEQECKDSSLINLASEEYAKVVRLKNLSTRVITPIFKDDKHGVLKTIGIFAKKARGTMLRYIVDNELETPENLKHFEGMGYHFDANLSTENKWIFTR